MLNCFDLQGFKYLDGQHICCSCCDHLDGVDLIRIRFRGRDGLTKRAEVCCKTVQELSRQKIEVEVDR